MTGLFLVLFGLLALTLIIIEIKIDTDMWAGGAGVVFGIIFIGLLIALPISRYESKIEVIQLEVFLETLDNSRSLETESNLFERATVMNNICRYNKTITRWQYTNDKWWKNKWYLHPSVDTVKLIE